MKKVLISVLLFYVAFCMVAVIIGELWRAM